VAIKRSIVAASAAWACVLPVRAEAGESCRELQRTNVAGCAVAASLALQQEQHALAAQQGRERAESALLPTNPTLSLSAAQRRTSADHATNWYATLSQEVEVAGQRGARRLSAAATRSAQEHAASAMEREVAASAWRAYFEALAARAALDTARHLEATFARIAQAVHAGALQGLVSGVDADVAELTVVRLSQARIEAERRFAAAQATLAAMVVGDPLRTLPLSGELRPLVHASALSREQAAAAASRRPELSQGRELRQAYAHSITALRRARVPNLTFSLFAQRDGFDERVLGGGIALPIPLPHPIGRTYTGEIAEQEAWRRGAEVQLERVEREARLEAVAAWHELDAAKAEHALYSEARVEKAEQTLVRIADQLAAGRLTLVSVLLAQETLIEFLRARVGAQLAVCLRSVELARASGLPLLGGEL